MRAVVAMALALTLSACGSTSMYHVLIGARSPAHQRDVPLLLEGTAPSSNYVEVAVLQAIGRGTHADNEHVVDALRAEAASLGCDAVLSVHVDQGSSAASGVGVGVRWAPGAPPPMPAPRTPAAASEATPGTPWSTRGGATSPQGTVTAPWAAPTP